MKALSREPQTLEIFPGKNAIFRCWSGQTYQAESFPLMFTLITWQLHNSSPICLSPVHLP